MEWHSQHSPLQNLSIHTTHTSSVPRSPGSCRYLQLSISSDWHQKPHTLICVSLNITSIMLLTTFQSIWFRPQTIFCIANFSHSWLPDSVCWFCRLAQSCRLLLSNANFPIFLQLRWISVSSDYIIPPYSHALFVVEIWMPTWTNPGVYPSIADVPTQPSLDIFQRCGSTFYYAIRFVPRVLHNSWNRLNSKCFFWSEWSSNNTPNLQTQLFTRALAALNASWYGRIYAYTHLEFSLAIRHELLKMAMWYLSLCFQTVTEHYTASLGHTSFYLVHWLVSSLNIFCSDFWCPFINSSNRAASKHS